MVAEGRTIAQAIAAGNYFRFEVHSAPDDMGKTRVTHRYDPPACETIEEVAACFLELFGPINPGSTAKAWRIKGGRIGSYHVEEAGDVTSLLLKQGLRVSQEPGKATTVVAVPSPDMQAVLDGRAVTLLDFTQEGAIGATYLDGRLALGCREQSYVRNFRR